ncbi:MAG: hypothetical protein Q9226_001895 [Calogaya cf. arnoldii]
MNEKFDLITANTQEVMRPDIIRKILVMRPLEIFWGTATTGRPHAAYFVPAIKIAQFLRAGCLVKVLLADLHGFLDADKSPEATLEKRAQYYERTIGALLRAVGFDLDNLTFVRGSSYQLTPKFSRDLLRLSKRVSVHDAVKASSEIVKSTGDPVMADGLYPMMQLLDEEYLGVDAEFGGIDQRKTFALANDTITKAMGFKTRAHIMNPMVPGLSGGKMSSSDPKSKVDLLDEPATIENKIAKAFYAPVLKGQTEATIFRSFDEVVLAYKEDRLTPQIAKKLVTDGLIQLTTSIRKEFDADEEWQRIAIEAYTTPIVSSKATKKQRKNNTNDEGTSQA